MTKKSKNNKVTHFESVLYRTTSTLCVTADCVILVDPNWLPNEIETIKSILEKVRESKPVVLIFTHSDFDHVLGYGAFHPDYVIAHQKLFQNPGKEQILEEIRDFDEKMYIQRDYPLKYPQNGIEIMVDQQSFSIGDTQLIFHLAPGHTDDGIFCVIESLNLLIVGDYLSNIEFPFIYHSLDDYRNTLEKASQIIKTHSIQMMIPGHGDIATTKKEMTKRIQRDTEYLQNFMLPDFNFDEFVEEFPFPRGLLDEHSRNLEKWGS